MATTSETYKKVIEEKTDEYMNGLHALEFVPDVFSTWKQYLIRQLRDAYRDGFADGMLVQAQKDLVIENQQEGEDDA